MSKYEECTTNISEGPHLVAALQQLGFNPTVHETPQQLEGYHGDLRPERAHVVIPRAQVGGAANDIGFIKEGGSYRAIISQYDSHRYTQSWLDKLTQTYAECRAMAIAKQKGYRFLGKTVENGKVKLQFAGR